MSEPVSGSERSGRLHLGSAIAWTTARSVAVGLVALVAAPIVAQALGADGRGRLVAVQLAPQLLADLGSLGLGFAVVHFGVRRTRSVRSLLRWSIKPLAVGSVLMFAIGQALAAPIAGDSSSDERLMRWYLLICPIVAFMTVAIEAVRALGDFKTWNLFVFLSGISWPVVLLVAVTVSDNPLPIVVVAHLALSAGLLVVVWAAILRMTDGCDADPTTSRQDYVRFGVASAISTLPRSANAKLDQLVMTVLVSRSSLGLYAVAVGWGALTIPIMRGLTGVVMPYVSGARGHDRADRAAVVVTTGLAAVVGLTFAGLLATVVLFRPLYGDAYEGAFVAAMVMIPAALLLEYNAVLGNVLRSLDRPALVAILEAVVMIGSIFALLLVLPRSEVLGPAYVSLGAYLLAAVLYAGAIARRLDVAPRSLIAPGRAIRAFTSGSFKGARSAAPDVDA